MPESLTDTKKLTDNHLYLPHGRRATTSPLTPRNSIKALSIKWPAVLLLLLLLHTTILQPLHRTTCISQQPS